MKTQPKKTIDEIRAIVAAISFMDRTIRVEPMGDGAFLQVRYSEADINTGKVELQSARKWYVSSFSTESEVVETAFKACRISMEHVVREHFTYLGRRVYSPHFDVQMRIEACDAGRSRDGRIPRPAVLRLAVSRSTHTSIWKDSCRPGILASDAPAKWVDAAGVSRRTPTVVGRLKPGKCSGHRALREFVIARDMACTSCGTTTDLVADHIISRRNGGAHHPDNLQALCQRCNTSKTGTCDSKRGPAG